MSDMKEKLFELKLQLGYKFDKDAIESKNPKLFDESIKPDIMETKDEKIVELFEEIISCLVQELLNENGFYY